MIRHDTIQNTKAWQVLDLDLDLDGHREDADADDDDDDDDEGDEDMVLFHLVGPVDTVVCVLNNLNIVLNH
jgi:hypothetical protein